MTEVADAYQRGYEQGMRDAQEDANKAYDEGYDSGWDQGYAEAEIQYTSKPPSEFAEPFGASIED